MGGIEPPCAAWKAAVLPLNYTRGDEGRPSAVALATPGQVIRWGDQHHSVMAARQPWHSDATGACRLSSMWPFPNTHRTWRPGEGRGMVGEAGFEPAKAVPSDLQSDPFGRSGIPPRRDLAECQRASTMNVATDRAPTVRPRCERSTRKPVQAHVPSPCGEASCSRVIL